MPHWCLREVSDSRESPAKCRAFQLRVQPLAITASWSLLNRQRGTTLKEAHLQKKARAKLRAS